MKLELSSISPFFQFSLIIQKQKRLEKDSTVIRFSVKETEDGVLDFVSLIVSSRVAEQNMKIRWVVNTEKRKKDLLNANKNFF